MIEARNFTYMFYGFAAAFLILVVYVVSLALRERKLRNEIDRVRRMLEKYGRSLFFSDALPPGG
jgi:CcmD family protein